MILSVKKTFTRAFLSLFLIPVLAFPVSAAQFTPPKEIVSKEKLPINEFNLIRTKQGGTYLITPDGRYVFQGALFDVWNGEQVQSIDQMKKLGDKINLNYLGIDPDKMFTLTLGKGSKEVFIFSDPNCSLCHKLLKAVRDSKMIQANFRVRAVITPILTETSMDKSLQLAQLAKKNPEGAVDAFINNSYDTLKKTVPAPPGIHYNLLVAKALSIRNFPYLVNSRGRIHIGMPEDLFLFLSEQ